MKAIESQRKDWSATLSVCSPHYRPQQTLYVINYFLYQPHSSNSLTQAVTNKANNF